MAHTVPKIQNKYETARACSQIVHSCAAKQADRSWKYINLSQIHECDNWVTEHYNSVLKITRPHSFIFGSTKIGTRHLYWILTGPSFAVQTKWMTRHKSRQENGSFHVTCIVSNQVRTCVYLGIQYLLRACGSISFKQKARTFGNRIKTQVIHRFMLYEGKSTDSPSVFQGKKCFKTFDFAKQ